MTGTKPTVDEWFSAIRSNSLYLIEKFIDRKADINAKDHLGMTALMHVTQCNPLIVRLLLDKGADLYIKSDDGFTALNFATMAQRSETIKILTEAAAAPKKQALRVTLRNAMLVKIEKMAAPHKACTTKQDMIRSQRPATIVRRRPIQ